MGGLLVTATQICFAHLNIICMASFLVTKSVLCTNLYHSLNTASKYCCSMTLVKYQGSALFSLIQSEN